MIGIHFGRRVVIAVALLCPLSSSLAVAGDAQDIYYQAYFLEHEKGDFAGAAKLYSRVAAAKDVGAGLKSQARARLAACREEIASSDLLRLMPPDALGYAELNRPGEQIGRLLKSLGLLAGDQPQLKPGAGRRIAVSPVLLKELLGLRGVAVAITGFDPESETPTGVIVINPGNLQVLRGIVESALPAAAETVEPTRGRQTFFVPEAHLYVCLTSRLIIASPDRNEIDNVLGRLDGTVKESLATVQDLPEVFAQRDDSMVFFCLNAKKIVPLLSKTFGMGDDLAQARAILDLDSLRWVTGRAGVNDDGVFIELAARMDAGHHNLAYNLARTPPISPETFASVPKGAAAFVAGALSEPGTQYRRPSEAGAGRPTVTGLDIGREIFANVKDFAIFVLPPKTDGRSEGPPIPDVAAVIRVHDSSRSEALWTQILGIASMAAGAPASDGKTVKIGGIDATAYQFPQGVTILVGTKGDKLFIATTHEALRRAGAADSKGGSILSDKAFAASLASLDGTTSKAAFINPGRCLQIGRQFMSEGERDKTEPFVDLLSRTIVAVRTNESEQELRITAQISGLPDIGPLVSGLIEREGRRHSGQHESRSARRSGERDGAMEAVAHEEHDHNDARDDRRKFEDLARNPAKREQALKFAKRFAKTISDNPRELNNFAWGLLTNDQYRNQFDTLALRLAQKACQQTDQQNWAFLDTLALANYRAGKIDAAIKFQKKAVTLQGGDHHELNESLARYEAGKK
ncbi:MAG: hypothetical protein IH895_07775, partial [Planctomycetes bacterium]|nr:hypothetical protein [Planctomycetota bacterium]